MSGTRGTAAVRLWRRVDKNGPVPSHAPRLGRCWVWTGSVVKGYGCIVVDGRKVATHRLAWRLAHGVIGRGLYICHSCDNRACVRPSHLFEGTHLDNMQDAVSKGRVHPGEAHGMSKLGVRRVLAIRRMAAKGLPQRVLATRAGVNQSTISMIVSRKLWKHVA